MAAILPDIDLPPSKIGWLFWFVAVPLERCGRLEEVGSKGEMILLSGLLVAAAALYPLSHLGFRDGLQALLQNFEIAREQYSTSARRERIGARWN
ncbi:MAG: hypothetical protein RKO66_17910 [Candidatus Contendobacter sp.]|nr:hypothetical protein [Candidatus Contendobacter sp.]MDS4058018.1 hypothetical protein [Candidatus Contendobacter sp.]